MKVYIFNFSISDNFPSHCNYIFLKSIFWTCWFSLLDLSSILCMATSCLSFKASWNGISSMKQILTSISSISPFCLCAPEYSAWYRANARHHHHHHIHIYIIYEFVLPFLFVGACYFFCMQILCWLHALELCSLRLWLIF